MSHKKHSRPRILVTNDDGINAPGIRNLWQCLTSYADLFVVAPSQQQSATALGITLRNPLHINRINWGPEAENVWSVSGTPADCVKLALSAILDFKPDLIVSGINHGGNLGRNVLYSGTIGAAIEGVMQGVPGIAFSCVDFHVEPDYQTASSYVPLIVQHVLEHPLPKATLLNVNFPERKLGKFKGFKMTHQGQDVLKEDPDVRTHPGEGNKYYWMGTKLEQGEYLPDSDDAWIKQGFVTAVPVHVGDLTDRTHVERTKAHFDKMIKEE